MPSRSEDNSARPAPDYSARQKPLTEFRTPARRPKIHPAELAALAVVGLHLVFLPWALGTMRPWAQFISAGLAITGMALALLPRNYRGEHSASEPFCLLTWPRLIRFPIFWIGLALLGYVAAQGLNPAWAYRSDGKNWWMEAIPHRGWLPPGVSVPFEKWGPWRMLLIYASAWLTVCTLWIAFTRRRTIQYLLMALAVNGALLAVFGLIQQRLGNGKIFWCLPSPTFWFFSSFVYKNHAGAYLNLTLAITCGLVAWYYVRGLRRMEKSHPGGVFAFFAIGIAVGVIASLSRGATLVMLGFVLVCAGAFIVHQLRLPRGSRRPLITLAMILVFGFFLTTAIFAMGSREALSRLVLGVTQQDTALATRQLATTAALEMLDDHGMRGVGAGSFRFLFTVYQARHPALVSQNGDLRFWEHAHNDVVQIPIELGLVGTGLVLLAGGYWMLVLIRSRFWGNPLGACTVSGLLLLVIYAWWDFPFQCPAILITWCALWGAAARWTQFEEKG